MGRDEGKEGNELSFFFSRLRSVHVPLRCLFVPTVLAPRRGLSLGPQGSRCFFMSSRSQSRVTRLSRFTLQPLRPSSCAVFSYRVLAANTAADSTFLRLFPGVGMSLDKPLVLPLPRSPYTLRDSPWNSAENFRCKSTRAEQVGTSAHTAAVQTPVVSLGTAMCTRLATNSYVEAPRRQAPVFYFIRSRCLAGCPTVGTNTCSLAG